MHDADNTYTFQSTRLCYWQVRFLTVSYNGGLNILNLLLINLLVSLLWMCPVGSIGSLGVKPSKQGSDR